MENASKALIIAGAILLAILLISLGIFIFTGAQNVTDNSGIDAQEIATFNAAIMKYEGTNKTAADVRSLKNELVAANKTLAQRGIGAISIGTVPANSYDTSNLSNSQKYTIKIESYDSSGYISKVSVNLVTN